MPETRTDRVFDIIHEGMAHYLSLLGVSLDKATRQQKGKALTYFYVNKILSGYESIDESEIEQNINIDRSGDLGVDYIYENDKDYNINIDSLAHK